MNDDTQKMIDQICANDRDMRDRFMTEFGLDEDEEGHGEEPQVFV
jgi:hypothetical protein